MRSAQCEVRGVVALEAELGTTGGLWCRFPPLAPPSPRTPSPQGGTQQPADDTSESNIHCLTEPLSPTLYYRHASLRNTTPSTLRCLRCLREFTPLCQRVGLRRPATNVLPLLHLWRGGTPIAYLRTSPPNPCPDNHHVLETHQEYAGDVEVAICALLTLCTELKETHLAPLANTFSRSSSTSTIVPEQPKQSSTPSSTASLDSRDPNGIGRRAVFARQTTG